MLDTTLETSLLWDSIAKLSTPALSLILLNTLNSIFYDVIISTLSVNQTANPGEWQYVPLLILTLGPYILPIL